jgi:hypothetical protein
MGHTFNIKKVDQMAVTGNVKGSIIYRQGGSEEIDKILARLDDPDLQKTIQQVDPGAMDKELLSEIGNLQTQINALIKQIGQEQRGEILKLNEALTTEAQNPKRDHERVRLSAEGLKAAACAVAGMAEPVAKTIKVILSLMGS